MFLRSAWHSRGQSLDDDWEEATPDRADAGLSGQAEQAIDLDAALATLPAVSRVVIWLHDVEGFTHREIAALMGKTESFSKSQLSRAYQRLRPMLQAETAATDGRTSVAGAALGSCWEH
jgi:RNA polymerase sigma-70 factor (ECF subfamily)